MGIGALAVGFVVSFAFYSLSGKRLRKIDFLGCFATILGLILLLIIYPLLNVASITLIKVFSGLSFVAFMFGAIIFFFFQQERRKSHIMVKCIAFVIVGIIQVYYFACLLFAPMLKEQLGFVIPIVFNVSIIIFILAYFLQLKSDSEMIVKNLKN